MLVDHVADGNFLRVFVNHFTPWVVGEQALEAGRTVAVEFDFAAARVDPVNAVGASLATLVGNAAVGSALSTFGTSFLNASLTTLVAAAAVVCAYSTIGTSVLDASLTTFVENAAVESASSTFGTSVLNASLATLVGNAAVGSAFSTPGASVRNASPATSVGFALATQLGKLGPLRIVLAPRVRA
jgi:hypothetical protein